MKFKLDFLFQLRIRTHHPNNVRPWEKYDLMLKYRKTVNEDDVEHIMADVYEDAEALDKMKEEETTEELQSVDRKLRRRRR